MKSMVLLVKEDPAYLTFSNLGRVMVSFRSDCREGFVISYSYGMGDPLAPLVPP
jgi:hypothetical protein